MPSPTAAAVTKPGVVTANTEAGDALQTAAAVTSLVVLSLNVAVAANWVVVPGCTTEGPLIATETSVAAAGRDADRDREDEGDVGGAAGVCDDSPQAATRLRHAIPWMIRRVIDARLPDPETRSDPWDLVAHR